MTEGRHFSVQDPLFRRRVTRRNVAEEGRLTVPDFRKTPGRAGKVLVAMSGGVDSAVAAFLLCRAGYEVAGFTVELISAPAESASEDGLSEDSRDAARICRQLGIGHHVIHMEDRFRDEVIGPFVCAYFSGKTPNPCVRCNSKIKFSAFMEIVDDLGYDYLATGHYARIEYCEKQGEYQLLRSGTAKDQSYVLYAMTQRQLSRTIFPLSDRSKSEIRDIAREAGFPVSEKPDSQDICFIPDNDYARFIEGITAIPIKEGDFVDKNGRVLGRHKGLIHYTVGQRKGIGIASKEALYVTAIDTKNGCVVLGPERDLFSSRLVASDIRYVSDKPVLYPFSAQAQIRYAAPAVPVIVFEGDDGTIEVRFDEPVRAITPGQTVVLYQGDKVLGGGEIVRSI
ncbi:MAG: tRNA 2-thiouridine(34) synthase MnmA [Clostridiales bacterium]|nr:tRNA 2-thiouridine(34) synthase MnmA [Clostridiales bacterium]